MLKLKYVATYYSYIASYDISHIIQVSNDYEFFKETMEIHVKISLDGAQYTRCSTFCLLTLSIFTREYSLSPMSKYIYYNIAS